MPVLPESEQILKSNKYLVCCIKQAGFPLWVGMTGLKRKVKAAVGSVERTLIHRLLSKLWLMVEFS